MFLSAATGAVHALLYYGPFDANFATLGRATRSYRDEEGATTLAAVPTRRTVDSVTFKYMRRGGDFVVVGVERGRLATPVPLVAKRHADGNGFGAVVPLGNGSATRLLEDIIAANPGLRRRLEPVLWGLGSWCHAGHGRPVEGTEDGPRVAEGG